MEPAVGPDARTGRGILLVRWRLPTPLPFVPCSINRTYPVVYAALSGLVSGPVHAALNTVSLSNMAFMDILPHTPDA